MKGICKRYPGVQALNNANLTVKKGEIHCLMGENGAGKSTLIKILAGAEHMDKGDILFNGEKVFLTKPEHALKIGISFIYQELNVIEPLTVEDNITLGFEYTNYALINRKKNLETVTEILKELHLAINPRAMVRTLTVPQKQMMLIAKAFSRNSKLIVLDEPTAALTDRETKELFRLIGQLKEKGVSFLFISHRFEDVFTIGDAITVYRDGKTIGTVPTAETIQDDIIRMM
ncbi:MAG: ATP-binding cassette domain-containing protein, partial [Treponema sp.]|nr:ATP-binding cassette domain-containing protein [Treponema sp.]